ncbi:PCYCGC motif-containing (lipo)protein [Alkalihalobacterium chitinilyticum]|uniref:GerMN domain-containing protein n=1 Tax=Alkalihalobacterium chitinilyticum TaxID=2980103 RepID=A0ABT5VI17_9BACI|nr:PCYCGC motif-containing (lipo)protein [Alkalihalobacterium chitinilyticum]MDE5415103.1 GerMN domain-containing protein [Alkalihalobacterium chitinilyticum]
MRIQPFLIFIGVALLIIILIGCSTNDQNASVSADSKVDRTELVQIASFGLEGCTSCDNAKEILSQLEEEFADLNFIQYNVINDVDVVNDYGVKEHPTVLFLNSNGEELKRLEKETDLDPYRKAIEFLQTNEVEPILPQSNSNQENSILISIFAVDKEDGKYLEIPRFVKYNSEVRYPRISAIQELLAIKTELPEQVTSPIPDDVEFVQIDGADGVTIVTVSNHFDQYIGTTIGQQTEELIALTLLSFDGVEKVQIITESYEGDILTEELLDKKSQNQTFLFEHNDEWMPIIGVDEYNTNILHQHDLEKIPCFCGCGEIGHTSNHNCFFTYNEDGQRILEKHGEYCQVCLDLTNIYVELKGEGKALQEIREYIDRMFEGYIPTETPQP